MPRPAGGAPGPQRRGGPPGGAHGARALLRHPADEPLRAEELLLSRSAEGLPDQPVRRAVQRSRAPRDRGRRGEEDRRHHARPHGGRRRQERALRGRVGRRPEPLGRRRSSRSWASRTCGAAPRPRSTCVPCARSSSSSASTTATSRRGAFAATPTSASAPWARRSSARASSSRTSTRSGSSRRPSTTRSSGRPRCSSGGGRIVQETRGWNEDKGTTFSCAARKRRRTTATSPTRICRRCVLDEAFVAEVQAAHARAAVGEAARASSTRWGSRRTRRRCSRPTRSVAAFFEEAAALLWPRGHEGRQLHPERGAARRAVARPRRARSRSARGRSRSSSRLVDAGTISGKQAKEVYARSRAPIGRLPRSIARARACSR